MEVMAFSALAAGSCPGGSSRAIIELRAGELRAKQTAWSATTAYRSRTSSTPAKVTAASPTESTNDPAALKRPSLRRSTVSATAPLYSPSSTSGTNEQRPISPTENADPVMS